MNIKTVLRPADEAGIDQAAQLLRRGEIFALPTETVYGIAADANWVFMRCGRTVYAR